MATGYSIGNDPYKAYESLIPARVSSKDSLKAILTALASMQNSRAGIEALGGKAKPQTKKGLLSTLFDPKKGVLFAPARFVSAGVADALNLAQDEVRELQEQNPLMSAFRAAKGDFAVTGGDIIKTNDGDSNLARFGKLAGALGYDLVTDPLNYLGTPSALSRKTLLHMLPKSDDLAKIVTGLAGKDADTILQKMALQSPDILKGTFIPGVNDAGEQIFKAAPKFVNEGEAAVTRTVREMAHNAFENKVAAAGTRGSKNNMLTTIEGLVDGDKALAQSIFDSLPKELRGGLQLVDPILGKFRTTIAGGRGKYNPLMEVAAKARFAASTGKIAMGVSNNLSGKTGEMYGLFKTGLKADEKAGVWQTFKASLKEDAFAAGKFENTQWLDYVGSKNATTAGRIAGQSLGEVGDSVEMGVFQNRYVAIGKKPTAADATKWSNRVMDFMEDMSLTPKAGDKFDVAAHAAAVRLREGNKEYLLGAKMFGLDIADAGEGHIPLTPSPAALQDAVRQGKPLGGYRPDLGREAYTETDIATGVMAALPPRQANIEAIARGEGIEVGPGVFEGPYDEDPLRIMRTQAAAFKRAVESHVVKQSLHSAGIILDVNLGATQIAKQDRLAAILTHSPKATQATIKQMEDANQVQVDKFNTLTSQKTVDNYNTVHRGLIVTNETAMADTFVVEGTKKADLKANHAGQKMVRPSEKVYRGMLGNKEIASVNGVIQKQTDDIVPTVKKLRASGERLKTAERNVERLQAPKKDAFDPIVDDNVRAAQEKLDAVQRDLTRIKAEVTKDEARLKLAAAETLDDELGTAVKLTSDEKRVIAQARAANRKILANANKNVKDAKDAEFLAHEYSPDSEEFQRRYKLGTETEERAAMEAARELHAAHVWDLNLQREIRGTYKADNKLNKVDLASGKYDDFVKYEQLVKEEGEILAELAANLERRKALRAEAETLARYRYLPSEEAIREQNRRWSIAHTARVQGEKLVGPGAKATPEQEAQLKILRTADKRAKKALYDTVGNFTRGKTTTLGKRYADLFIDISKTINSDEMDILHVVVNDAKLSQISKHVIEQVAAKTLSNESALKFIGDLVSTAQSMRHVLPKGQYEEFDKLANEVFSKKDSLITIPSNEIKARLAVLRDNLDKAKVAGADADTIAKLDREVETLESLKHMKLSTDANRLPHAFDNAFGSDGVKSYLQAYYDTTQSPDGFLNMVEKVWGPMMVVWRTGATTGRGPGYALNNFMGGMLSSWIGGVRGKDIGLSFKAHFAFTGALDEVKKAVMQAEKNGLPALSLEKQMDIANTFIDAKIGKETITSLYGTKKPLREFYEELHNSGLYMTGQAGELEETHAENIAAMLASGRTPGIVERGANSFVAALLENPVNRMLLDKNQQLETLMRTSAMISGWRRAGSMDAGRALVTALHFDYQDVTRVERGIRHVVPFYTWSRNNVPLQIRAALMQQDKFRKLILVNENMQKAFGTDEGDSWLNDVLPEYMGVVGGFATKFTFGGNHLGLALKTPMQDIDSLFQMGSIHGMPIPMLNNKQVSGMIGPSITPLEWLAGRSFTTGQTYETTGEKLQFLTTSLLPQYGTATRIANAGTTLARIAGVDVPTVAPGGFPILRPEKGVSDLFNFLAGSPVSMTTLGEKAITGGLMRRTQGLAGQLADLAASANVDIDWLRKELNKGTSIQALKVKIAAGEGDVQKLQREALLKPQKEPRRDYAAMLRSLGQGGFDTGL